MIDILPDDVLLEIFNFYKDDSKKQIVLTWKWKTLTQVCRRWRHIIIASPRRLELQVICTNATPTQLLDHWPTLPITIIHNLSYTLNGNDIGNTIIATVNYRDRISEVYITNINDTEWEKLEAVMQEPLPALRLFFLDSNFLSIPARVLPETFMGGSAPNLQLFHLQGVSFPTLPTFVLSAAHIVELRLLSVPNSGYISPEAMATCLLALPKLEYLSIGFDDSHLSLPHQISPPRTTRAILPALTNLWFRGVSEYFADFVARIDTTRLNLLIIVSLSMDVYFDIPRPRESPGPFNEAEIVFSGQTITVILRSPNPFEVQLRCELPGWLDSSITQVFGQQLPHLSHVEQLEIREPLLEWTGDPTMLSSKWLELLHLFIAVQNLYVSKNLVPHIAAALQESYTGPWAMEVLPALHNLSLEGFQPSAPVEEGINTFIAARQLSDQPVVVQCWELQPPDDYEPYYGW